MMDGIVFIFFAKICSWQFLDLAYKMIFLYKT